MSRRHELKTWPSHFEQILSGAKTFELRRNDRDYAVGDVLVLREWDPAFKRPEWDCYTRRKVEVAVTHILHGGQFDLPQHMCVMSIRRLAEQDGG